MSGKLCNIDTKSGFFGKAVLNYSGERNKHKIEVELNLIGFLEMFFQESILKQFCDSCSFQIV